MPVQIERVKFSSLCQFTPRQWDAVHALERDGRRFLLYGGALGGGKSFMLRWYLLRRLMWLYSKYGLKRVTVMLACEDYPALKDRQLQKIEFEFPDWIGRMAHDHKVYGKAFVLHDKYGGGAICFRNLDDPSKYQSAEFAAIAVDELTKNTYEIFTFLRSRLRWPGLPDHETQFIAGTNPGGIGHGWVKQFWIDRIFPDEWIHPVDFRPYFGFVQSKADDNPHLDTSYWSSLQTLPENLRKAFRDGDWNIFVGQAFPEFNPVTHVVDPVPVPAGAQVYMTMDWGFGAPFSVCWFWVDADNRVYLFDEWYGWSGTANQGLRLSDTDIALGIKQREADMGLSGRSILRLAGPDCFQKRPDYRGGGQGPSTSEVFAEHDLFLSVGDPSRELKLRAFRERIRLQPDGKPMLMVYSNCKQFIRTIPNLIMDDAHIEDIDTKGEDHIFDAVCHVCMARPISMQPKKPRAPETDLRIDRMTRVITDPIEAAMALERKQTDQFFSFDDPDYGMEDNGGNLF